MTLTHADSGAYNAPVSEESRRLLVVMGILTLAVVGALGFWRHHEAQRPQLLSVAVVFLPEGEETARPEWQPLPPERPVRAGALLKFRQGRGVVRYLCPFPKVFWHEAVITPEPLSAWPSAYGVLKAQWFTLEPAFFGGEVTDRFSAGKLAYGELAAPELGTGLQVLVQAEAHNDDFLTEPLAGNTLGGGIWRLKVKVGAYRDANDLLPWASVSSAGAQEVHTASGLPRMAPLPEGINPRLALAFRCAVFTFTPGVWPSGGEGWPWALSPEEMVRQLLVLTPQGMAALAAVGDPLADPWDAPQSLRWRGGKWVDRGGRRLRWGKEVAVGDALSWSGRWAVLWADDGSGLLDAGDRVLVGWQQPPRLADIADVASATEEVLLFRVRRAGR